MSRGKIVYKVTVCEQNPSWRMELMQILHLNLILVINTYCVKKEETVYLNTEIKFILITGK
jgi:hypothetical protein